MKEMILDDIEKIEKTNYDYITQNSPLKDYVDFVKFENISKSYKWIGGNKKANAHIYPYFVWNQILEIVFDLSFKNKGINGLQLEKYLKENNKIISLPNLNEEDNKLLKKYYSQIKQSNTNGAYGNTFFRLLYLPKGNIKTKNNQIVPENVIFNHIKMVLTTWRENANLELKNQIEKWLNFYQKNPNNNEILDIKNNFRSTFFDIEKSIASGEIKTKLISNISDIYLENNLKQTNVSEKNFLEMEERKKQVGLYGEKIVVELLKKEYKNNLDIEIIHSSLENKFSPYDIEIYSKSQRKTLCYVEVKSSTIEKGNFYISDVELKHIQSNNHRVYFVNSLEKALSKIGLEKVIFTPMLINYVDKFEYEISNEHYGFQKNKFLLLPIKFKGKMP